MNQKASEIAERVSLKYSLSLKFPLLCTDVLIARNIGLILLRAQAQAVNPGPFPSLLVS